jgi:hypothetical protein
MGTTYTSTINVKCWKEHDCLHCAGKFGYLLERTVTGQASSADAAAVNARNAAANAIATEVDFQPCPTCGLYQPDMVGAQRARKHGRLFWAGLIFFAALLVVYAVRWINASTATTLAVVGGAALTLANWQAGWRNPNGDAQANVGLAGRLVKSGKMRVSQAGQTKPADPELFTPGLSTGQRVALALMVAAVCGIMAPEVMRMASGWPLNADWRPPVAGPGDETTLYLSESIESIKGYWRGTASATATIDGEPDAAEVPVSAVTEDDSWGNSISAKSSEKSSGSRLWVTLTLPDREDLTGKTLDLSIELTATYPVSQGNMFDESTDTFHETAELQVASAGAGKTYNTLWWGGTLGGAAVLLAMTLSLKRAAKSLKKKALPTTVFLSQ